MSRSTVKVTLRDPNTHCEVTLPSEDDPKTLALRALEANKQKKIISIQAPPSSVKPPEDATIAKATTDNDAVAEKRMEAVPVSEIKLVRESGECLPQVDDGNCKPSESSQESCTLENQVSHEEQLSPNQVPLSQLTLQSGGADDLPVIVSVLKNSGTDSEHASSSLEIETCPEDTITSIDLPPAASDAKPQTSDSAVKKIDPPSGRCNIVLRYSAAELRELCPLKNPLPKSITLELLCKIQVGGNERGVGSSRQGSKGGRNRGDRSERGGNRNAGTSSKGSRRGGSNRTSPEPGSRSNGGDSAIGARGVALLPEDLKPLEKSETAWSPAPSLARPGATLGAIEMESDNEDTYVQAIEKRARGLLNKLSPDNFEKLKHQFVFKAHALSAVAALCGLMVRKSFEEPKYASLYAKLTYHVCLNAVVPIGMDEEFKEEELKADLNVASQRMQMWLRKTVILACQRQFEARPTWSDKSKGKITEEEFEEVVKIKSKALGNMRFVAELYNTGIMSKRVMSMIITQLLSEVVNPIEEDVECVLMLLHTIGGNVDRTFEVEMVQHWFAQLNSIRESPELLSRLQFAITDIIELKERGWQSDGTHSASVAPSPAFSRANSTKGTPRSTPKPDADGWISTAASPSQSSAGRRRDTNNQGILAAAAQKLKQQSSAPPRTPTKQSKAGAAKNPPIKKAPVNVFDLLSGLNENEERSSEESEGSDSEEEADAVEGSSEAECTVDDTMLSLNLSESDGNIKQISQPLDEQEIKKLSASILSDLFISREASNLVDDLKIRASSCKPQVIEHMLMHIASTNAKDAILIGKSLAQAVNENVLEANELVTLMLTSDLVEYFEDFKIDSPKLDFVIRAMLQEMKSTSNALDLSEMVSKLNFGSI
jgi:hypothetical protein